MTEYIPLLQALAWPALIGAICYWLRSDVPRVIRAVAIRIEQGDSIEAGATGIKLIGSQPKLSTPTAATSDVPSKVTAEDSVPHAIYLLHSARRDSRLDKNDHEYYRVRIWIDSDYPELLQQVDSVIYHLHPDFANPVRTVKAPESEFALATAAWGQFMLHATIQFKNGQAAMRIERYVNF